MPRQRRRNGNRAFSSGSLATRKTARTGRGSGRIRRAGEKARTDTVRIIREPPKTADTQKKKKRAKVVETRPGPTPGPGMGNLIYLAPSLVPMASLTLSEARPSEAHPDPPAQHWPQSFQSSTPAPPTYRLFASKHGDNDPELMFLIQEIIIAVLDLRSQEL
jgi:hypothetical protein